MNAVLEAIALEKRFGRKPVLDGLNLTVERGSVFALVGPNGAGKTTTIRILLNLVQASSGASRILGVDSRAISTPVWQRIGYVSEDQILPAWMTVPGFLSYLRPFYERWDDGLADHLMRQFHLPDTTRIRNLSRGTRMKAALASSLAYRPEVLILDEPFSGLDPLARDEFLEGVLENAGDMTVLISSHDLAEIESAASHIGYLDEGKLQLSEETEALSARFREVEVVLQSPAPDPASWPASWLRRETSAAVIRFVESQFNPARTPELLRQIFPTAQRIDIQPMPLRKIFIALAKSARKAA